MVNLLGRMAAVMSNLHEKLQIAIATDGRFVEAVLHAHNFSTGIGEGPCQRS